MWRQLMLHGNPTIRTSLQGEYIAVYHPNFEGHCSRPPIYNNSECRQQHLSSVGRRLVWFSRADALFHLQIVILHLWSQRYIGLPVSALMVTPCLMNAKPSAKSIFSARSLSTATSTSASSLQTPCQSAPSNSTSFDGHLVTSHHQPSHYSPVTAGPVSAVLDGTSGASRSNVYF